MLLLIIVLRIQKISFGVSHSVPYWVHYFLYRMLMISHIHQISLILFCLLKTPQFCEVNNWFKANKLSINASETNFMILGAPHMTSTKATKAREDILQYFNNFKCL